jgi:hypothetical protein
MTDRDLLLGKTVTESHDTSFAPSNIQRVTNGHYAHYSEAYGSIPAWSTKYCEWIVSGLTSFTALNFYCVAWTYTQDSYDNVALEFYVYRNSTWQGIYDNYILGSGWHSLITGPVNADPFWVGSPPYDGVTGFKVRAQFTNAAGGAHNLGARIGEICISSTTDVNDELRTIKSGSSIILRTDSAVSGFKNSLKVYDGSGSRVIRLLNCSDATPYAGQESGYRINVGGVVYCPAQGNSSGY